MLPRVVSSAGSWKAASRLAQLSSTSTSKAPLSSFYSTMSSNITLYTWPTPNGVKASITLEELALPYRTEGINISTNVQKEEYERHVF